MTVKELFATAADADSREQRRNAFRELRRISIYEQGPEAQEARFALEHSARYTQQLREAQT